MRYLPTSKLTPGMALGQDIYDGAGRLLLAKHLLLSEEYISNLEFLGFPGIYIDDEFNSDAAYCSDGTRSKCVRKFC